MKTSHHINVMLLGLFVAILTFPHLSFADPVEKVGLRPTTGEGVSSVGCPSGYQRYERYKSLQIKMRWLGEGGEFSTCLNQEYPEKNNFRDSWGTGDGVAWFKCGALNVRGYLRTAGRSLSLCTKPGLGEKKGHDGRSYLACLGRKVHFEPSSSDSRGEPWPETTASRPRKEPWCKEKGDSVTCFSESSSVHVYVSKTVPKKVEVIRFDREVIECAKVEF